jgi:hypothetical protein
MFSSRLNLIMMRILILILVCISVLASCRKSRQDIEFPDSPKAYYIDLKGREIKMNTSRALDLNRDGQRDISFGTLLVGDPVFKVDKHQYTVSTGFDTFLPVEQNERIPVMHAGESIPVENFSGYTWYNASYIILAQKIVGLEHSSYWEGSWKDARHNYIPVQVKKDGLRYNGWVEISFDMSAESIILHRALLNRQPEVPTRCDMAWQ